MQIITNADLHCMFKEIVKGFWSKMYDELAGGSFQQLKEFGELQKQTPLGYTIDGGNFIILDSVHKLAGDTLLAVESEMQQYAYMYASEPSKYLYKFSQAYVVHTARLKRELKQMGPNDLDGLTNYDMEADIRETEVTVNMLIESSFQNEIAYWKAMDTKNYAQAKVILQAIDAIRANAELPLKIEVLNWQLELSVCLGDIEMFLDALAKSLRDGGFLNSDSLKRLVERLFITRGINQLRIGMNANGKSAAIRHPGGPTVFMQEHVTIFFRSLVSQVVNSLVKQPAITVIQFNKLLHKAIDDSKTSFIAISPYVLELAVVAN